jgi:hypothetical protein
MLVEYLRSHPCVDCGETDVVVLTFDHHYAKRFNIGASMRRLKWETILKEIGKCCVRCANCHMRRTAKQQGWFKLLGS